MKLVIFGLTVSSSWGNGHATLWRGLIRALAARGHSVAFFERDVPYYAAHRDLHTLPGAKLILYSSWDEILYTAETELRDADAAMVTSYCPDGVAASALILSSAVPMKTFYDLDTPVTLHRLRAGEPVSYIGPDGLRDFDLVLSYTGGAALEELQWRLGARNPIPLYGSVDPEVHYPVAARPEFAADFSYLGTYAADRQNALKELFIEAARQAPTMKFVIGGAQYPPEFPWSSNIYFVRHLPPADHAAFYCSSRLTLNITRQAMAEMGYCPSGRLFEATACGAPVISDHWDGLDQFFIPGKEILVAKETGDLLEALHKPAAELNEIAHAARERTLNEHTAAHRAAELETMLQNAQKTELMEV